MKLNIRNSKRMFDVKCIYVHKIIRLTNVKCIYVHKIIRLTNEGRGSKCPYEILNFTIIKAKNDLNSYSLL